MRYFQMAEGQRLGLDDQGLSDAIRREAIERGIAPPLTLSESISRGNIAAYQGPANAVKFYEIMRPNEYGTQSGTGIAFATEEQAINAMQGAFSIGERGYPKTKSAISDGEFSVRVVLIGSASESKHSSVEEYEFDSKAFDVVVDECIADLTKIKQAAYDCELNKIKRAEYLRLANNNEEIARAFWAKTEKSEWPCEF